MSAPWEDTIVIALRDAQWMDSNDGREQPKVPDLFIKLDGDTEKALGDVIFRKDERLYLFEAKSSRSGVATEWNKKNDKGEPKEKAAFKSLFHLMGLVNASQGIYDPTYELSLACHHFVYWSDEVFDHSDTLGNIMIESYISACATTASCPMPDRFGDITYDFIEQRSGNGYDRSSMLPFSAIKRQTGFLIARDRWDDDDQGEVVGPIGATAEDFFAYLKFLLDHGGGGVGSLNAIICSDKGTFFKNIKSVDDLRRQYDSTGKYGADSKPRKAHLVELKRTEVRPSARQRKPGVLVFPPPPPSPQKNLKPKVTRGG